MLHRMGARSVSSILAVLLLSGCCRSSYSVVQNQPVRYRLALDREDAQACFRKCGDARMESRLRYAACLAACPNAEVEPGRECGSDDVPPAAECVVLVRKVRREAVNPWPAIVTVTAFAAGAAAGGYVGSGAGSRRSQ